MKLQFLRSSHPVEVHSTRPLVYQFENQKLFSRVVQSLVSERGEESIEPYVIWDDKGRLVNPKKAFVLFNALPCIPLDDSLLKALFQKIEILFNEVSELKSSIQDIWDQLQDLVEGTNLGYNGCYSFSRDFDLTKVLKLFGYTPSVDLGNELLDNCMSFFDLCADVQLEKPIVFVNAFRFFTDIELKLLYEKAIFNKIPLLLLESGLNCRTVCNEQYIMVDQHFIEY